MTEEPLFTITQLARRTGVSSRTIRFWSDRGLIPVAKRSAARYRLYDTRAVVRLELVHSLRELGVPLPAITALLKQKRTLAQVMTTHLSALDARIRDLRLQRAVLRVVLRRRDTTPKETRFMHKLLQTSAAERRKLIDDLVARAFAGIPDDAPGAHIARAMRSVPAELPDDPSDAQVEAWLELSGLASDPDFSARVREMALAGAAARPQQPIDIAAIREHAGAALAAGTAPDTPAALAVIERVLPGADAAEKQRVREALETFSDVRVERYWQLLATLNDRPHPPPVAAACAWFGAALRAGA
jgi:DNA-binding transcriptional MerR regulator